MAELVSNYPFVFVLASGSPGGLGLTVEECSRVVESSVHRSRFEQYLKCYMESSSLFITPKRKTRKSNTSSSSVERSPVEKRLKQSYSPSTWNGGDEIMMALNSTEGATEKLELTLAKFISLDSKMEELSLTVNGLHDEVALLDRNCCGSRQTENSRREIFTHGEECRICGLTNCRA